MGMKEKLSDKRSLNGYQKKGVLFSIYKRFDKFDKWLELKLLV